MPIVIQSRSFDETDWSNEVWRRTHFEAFVVAKTKAKLTGRIYRLVNGPSGAGGTARQGCHQPGRDQQCRNQEAHQPSPSWPRMPLPLSASVAMAITNPSMARRPLRDSAKGTKPVR